MKLCNLLTAASLLTSPALADGLIFGSSAGDTSKPTIVSKYVSVSSGADGSGCGAYNNPCQTINWVFNHLTPGDDWFALDGTYTNPSFSYLAYASSGGCTAALPCSIRALHYGKAIFDGLNTTAYGFIMDTAFTGYLRVSGFEFKNFTNTAFSLYATTNWTIDNNYIHNIGNTCTDKTTGNAGIYTEYTANYLTAYNNEIANIGRISNGAAFQAIPITAVSGNGTTVTYTYAVGGNNGALFSPTSTVTVAGSSIGGYNGTKTVVSATGTTFTATDATTGTPTGTITATTTDCQHATNNNMILDQGLYLDAGTGHKIYHNWLHDNIRGWDAQFYSSGAHTGTNITFANNTAGTGSVNTLRNACFIVYETTVNFLHANNLCANAGVGGGAKENVWVETAAGPYTHTNALAKNNAMVGGLVTNTAPTGWTFTGSLDSATSGLVASTPLLTAASAMHGAGVFVSGPTADYNNAPLNGTIPVGAVK